MKQLSEMPSEGQFIAVWECDGVLWCKTYRWNCTYLETYSDSYDHWETVNPNLLVQGCKYFCCCTSGVENESTNGQLVDNGANQCNKGQKYSFNINTKNEINWEEIGKDCTKTTPVLLISSQNNTFVVVHTALCEKIDIIGLNERFSGYCKRSLICKSFVVFELCAGNTVGDVKRLLSEAKNASWPEGYKDRGEVVVQPLNI